SALTEQSYMSVERLALRSEQPRAACADAGPHVTRDCVGTNGVGMASEDVTGMLSGIRVMTALQMLECNASTMPHKRGGARNDRIGNFCIQQLRKSRARWSQQSSPSLSRGPESCPPYGLRAPLTCVSTTSHPTTELPLWCSDTPDLSGEFSEGGAGDVLLPHVGVPAVMNSTVLECLPCITDTLENGISVVPRCSANRAG